MRRSSDFCDGIPSFKKKRNNEGSRFTRDTTRDSQDTNFVNTLYEKMR